MTLTIFVTWISNLLFINVLTSNYIYTVFLSQPGPLRAPITLVWPSVETSLTHVLWSDVTDDDGEQLLQTRHFWNQETATAWILLLQTQMSMDEPTLSSSDASVSSVVLCHIWRRDRAAVATPSTLMRYSVVMENGQD